MSLDDIERIADVEARGFLLKGDVNDQFPPADNFANLIFNDGAPLDAVGRTRTGGMMAAPVNKEDGGNFRAAEFLPQGQVVFEILSGIHAGVEPDLIGTIRPDEVAHL